MDAALELRGRQHAVALAAAFLLEAGAGGPVLLEELRASGGLARPVESDAPCASAVRLVDAIRAGRSARVELGVEGASTWSVAVRRVARLEGEGA